MKVRERKMVNEKSMADGEVGITGRMVHIGPLGDL